MREREFTQGPIPPGEIDLSCRFGALRLKHPVMTASGCFAYGEPFAAFMDLRELAGLVTKGISPDPRVGNPPPRICETASGMLNSIGLENVGSEVFLAEKLPFLQELGISVWVNFFGESFDGYVECARRLNRGLGKGIDVLEMNISCPNVQKGGIQFGTDPEVAHRLIRTCVEVTGIPIVVKLTPQATDPVAMAQAAAEAGALGVSVINTLMGMAIDVRRRISRLGTLYGGLSGPAIKPIALRIVHQIFTALPDLPIAGMGGITTGEDVLEFILAGASSVQIGTINFSDPVAALRIRDELRALMADLGLRSLASVRGSVARGGIGSPAGD